MPSTAMDPTTQTAARVTGTITINDGAILLVSNSNTRNDTHRLMIVELICDVLSESSTYSSFTR